MIFGGFVQIQQFRWNLSQSSIFIISTDFTSICRFSLELVKNVFFVIFWNCGPNFTEILYGPVAFFQKYTFLNFFKIFRICWDSTNLGKICHNIEFHPISVEGQKCHFWKLLRFLHLQISKKDKNSVFINSTDFT